YRIKATDAKQWIDNHRIVRQRIGEMARDFGRQIKRYGSHVHTSFHRLSAPGDKIPESFEEIVKLPNLFEARNERDEQMAAAITTLQLDAMGKAPLFHTDPYCFNNLSLGSRAIRAAPMRTTLRTTPKTNEIRCENKIPEKDFTKRLKVATESGNELVKG